MEFLLSGLGCTLRSSVVARVRGDGLHAAVREARRMLACNPDCDAVEIFTRGQFVREVSRSGLAVAAPEARVFQTAGD